MDNETLKELARLRASRRRGDTPSVAAKPATVDYNLLAASGKETVAAKPATPPAPAPRAAPAKYHGMEKINFVESFITQQNQDRGWGVSVRLVKGVSAPPQPQSHHTLCKQGNHGGLCRGI